MNYTPRLNLPLIHSGQAQKEITHNEALVLLDILLNSVVQEIGIEVPPNTIEAGLLFVIGINPEGEFANHQNEIALKLEHSWRFVAPRKWLEVTLDSDGSKYCWNGEYWASSGRISSNIEYVPRPTITTDQPQIMVQNDMLINRDNGEYLQVGHLEEELQLNGTYTDTSIQIPHHSIVISVNVRVLEQISGANSFSVGTDEDATRYGSNLSSNNDTTNVGLTNQPLTYWDDTPIRITANNGSFTGGCVHVTIQYLKPHGPWHWD